MTTDAPPAAPAGSGPGRIAARAIALKAALPETAVLTAAERILLAEWLDRLSGGQ